MPFNDYRTLGEALAALQVAEHAEAFVRPQAVAVNDYFRSELDLSLREFDVTCSEAAICENLLYPVLREAIKPFTDVLGVWSHVPLYHGTQFLGVPDYIIAKRSPLSRRVMGCPLAMIVEAKKNDFDAGWGQCLAAMCAGQALNGESLRVIYGIASDGMRWEFAKLKGRSYTRDPVLYQLGNLYELLGAMHHVLELCKQQVLSPAEAA